MSCNEILVDITKMTDERLKESDITIIDGYVHVKGLGPCNEILVEITRMTDGRFKESDITIIDGHVHVKGLGQVGLWWKNYDNKVCLSYEIGESFYASSINELKQRLLSILNGWELVA